MRAFILEHKDEDVTIGMVCDEFQVRPVIAVRVMMPWLDRGAVRFVDRGDRMVYRYVPPPNEHPTHRPRGEPHVVGVGSERSGGGDAVAYTGKARGPSGKPGLDKKRKDRGQIRKGRRGVK